MSPVNRGSPPAGLSASPCTCFKVRSLARRITQLYDEVLAPSGLTVTQYSLLAHARRPKGAPAPQIGELARILVTDRTTLTRNLRPLVAAGLIGIDSGADARTRVVRVTPAGEQTFRRAREYWHVAQRRVREIASPPLVSQLESSVDRMLALLSETASDED